MSAVSVAAALPSSEAARWLSAGIRSLTTALVAATWMAEGKVKAVIDQVFAFENAPEAYEKSRTGRAKGKIVINVSS